VFIEKREANELKAAQQINTPQDGEPSAKPLPQSSPNSLPARPDDVLKSFPQRFPQLVEKVEQLKVML